MTSEPQILFEWSKPQEIVDFEIKQMRSRSKIVVPLILLSTAIIELFVYIKCYSFLKSFPDNDIDLNHFSFPFIAVYILIIIFVIFLYWYYPRVMKRTIPKYKITDKGINIKTDSTFTHKWKKIKGFWLCSLDKFPDLTAVGLCSRKPRRILFTKESHGKIVSILNQYIPQIEEPLKYKDIKLSMKHHICFLITLFLYYPLSIILVKLFKFPNENLIVLLLLFTFYFGPGTFVLLLFFKKDFLKNHSLKGKAILYNLSSVALFILITILFYCLYFS